MSLESGRCENRNSRQKDRRAFTDQAALSEVERKMLEMRLDRYTTGEVAETLGIHPVAIRVRWTRLRQRLQAAGVFSDWL